MFRIVAGSTRERTDASDFIAAITGLEAHREFFAGDAEIFVARAPGRLDVMGGIADYSGSLVLEIPTREATFAALQKTGDTGLEILSLANGGKKRDRSFKMPLDAFKPGGEIISYSAARDYFRRDARDQWAAYVAGIFLVLSCELGVNFDKLKCGARILIASEVPAGKGVSSSAAIEVAAMNAVCAAYDIRIEPRELAMLCQKVENLVVGAPCGVMDQITSSCGEENKILSLLCQPAEMKGSFAIPDEIAFWGIDSGIRHSVGAGDYGRVRTGAFMGYRIIAGIAGFEIRATETPGVVEIDDPKWNGYLANISPEEFEREFAAHLPAQISGAEFLSRYQGITDPVTKIGPEKIYPVLKPAAHPVYENARVDRFAKLLNEPLTKNGLIEMGELMYASHESYSACGLGADGTDLLIELVKNTGGLYGAKITGGGSGGTVVVLGRKGADNEIEKIAGEYEKKTNYRPYIFSGSSPGAAVFGHLILSR
jgi:L-arabinokinase